MEKRTPIRRIISIALALLALGTAGSTLVLCSRAEEVRPYVEDGPGGPSETLDRFLDCVERGDWAAAGGPLGLETPPENPMSAAFWTAQAASRHVRAREGYEMEGTKLLKTAAVTVPGFSAAPARLHDRVQALLAEAVEGARLRSEVYDGTGAYRPELVLASLDTAVAELLIEAGQLHRRALGPEPDAVGRQLALRPALLVVFSSTS